GLRRDVAHEGAQQANPDLAITQPGRQIASVEAVAHLPTRWFGYAPVDLMIITTGNAQFVTELTSPREGQRQGALSDWVRQGGRLVISGGRNFQLMAEVLKVLKINPPVNVVGPHTARFDRLPAVDKWLPLRADRPEFRAQRLKNGEVPPIPLLKLE